MFTGSYVDVGNEHILFCLVSQLFFHAFSILNSIVDLLSTQFHCKIDFQMASRAISRVNPQNTALFVCDLQDKFRFILFFMDNLEKAIVDRLFFSSLNDQNWTSFISKSFKYKYGFGVFLLHLFIIY